MNFPSLIPWALPGGRKQRPRYRRIAELDRGPAAAEMSADFNKRSPIVLADVIGAVHQPAAPALSRHGQRLGACAGRALAPHVMGRDDLRQS